MPRGRRTQPPVAAPGQQYGVGGEQVAAQNEMPLPDNRGGTVAPMAPPMPGPVDPTSAIDLAHAMPFEPLNLGGPTAYPDEPLTAGIDMGAGPGSDSVMMPTGRARQMADMLEAFAAVSDSPVLARLAEDTRRRIS